MSFGLTTSGFIAKQLQDCKKEIEDSLRAAFGQNLNFAASSVFGQIVGIMSEREALVWQLAEAVYNSQYPGGAEGTSVDNILALNNLRRLPASPTKTSPLVTTNTDDTLLYGLVLRGTSGTVVPKGSIISVLGNASLQFKTDADYTIAAAVDAIQSLFFSSVPDVGTWKVTLGGTLLSAAIKFNALANQTQLSFLALPAGASHFGLTMTGGPGTGTTANISTAGAYPTSAAIQTAIRAVSGYSAVSVSGSAGSYTIDWGAIANPVLTVINNTTATTITVIDSVQACVNALTGYSAVTVSGMYSTGFILTFAGATGAQQQALATTSANSLQTGATVVNINVINSTRGFPAQAVGAATCSQNGPNFVAADTLTVIGSPVSGWASVTNPLDCVEGSNQENDTEALVRRLSLLAAQANGPLQAIVEKVKKVSGVTQVVGFQNQFVASTQKLTFSAVPVSGAFTLRINGTTTGSLAYNTTAALVQTAIRLLSGYNKTLVTGTVATGFVVDFNGSQGGREQSLFTVPSNTLNGGITVTPSYGRPGNSFEIVVQGGEAVDIATEIFNSMPAGIQSYGTSSEEVTDPGSGNVFTIYFSRPTQLSMYVSVVLETDLEDSNPEFVVSSIPTIQQDLVDIGNDIKIGGLVKGFGSNGLIGAFNAVPGIKSYTLYFGSSPSPGSNANIQLDPNQAALFETFNVLVTYS